MPSGAVACTSRPSTPPRCSPSSAAPPQRAPRSPHRRQLESRAWWRLRTSAPPRARRPRRCRRHRSGSGRKQRACWFESRELAALWPPSHSPVFWRTQGSRPLLRRDRSCAPHRLACAAACTRGGAVCVRLRPPQGFVPIVKERGSPATNRRAAPRRGSSCRVSRGRADSRSKRPPRYAARIPAPAPPLPAPAVRARCTGTQGRLAENLPATRGEAGRAARPARERAHRRGAAAGARGRVERPGLNGYEGNGCTELHAAAL